MIKFIKHIGKTTNATSQDINDLQANIERTVKQFTDREHLLSTLIEDVLLISGQENWVEHGLGKEIRGWRVVDINFPCIVWRVGTSTASLTKYLPLGVSRNCTVSLEVFS